MLLLLIIPVTIIVFLSFGKEPVSYWSFDETLIDLGSDPVLLYNSFPVYICGVNSTTYCFDSYDPTFAQIKFVKTNFNHGAYFNGLTFLTSGYSKENKFDFLSHDHPFTIELWITPSQLCIEHNCYHHYFISKTITNENNEVIGFACGEQRDASMYCYMRNSKEYLMVQTKQTFEDGVPIKFSVIHDGTGTYNGTNIFINGLIAEKKTI
ncbi:hypothetical protein NUZ5A_20238 [Candidatus Nitrosotenuis uzonensis]|uniref:Uncharacterized protein n=2 Tax=Candidatus Nitrosotenuis uzonensis TaxID=1407055 RepID=A0A812EUC1_9ARCH|nr:hypothetical protein NUZ5A_20238 [Candidatus Nitrosotenuis uzonensis]